MQRSSSDRWDADTEHGNRFSSSPALQSKTTQVKDFHNQHGVHTHQVLGQFVWMKELTQELRSLRFSDWNSVIMQVRTSGPKNLAFPKLYQKGKQDRQKFKFSFPTHWFSLTWPLIQPLTSLSDAHLTSPPLGPSSLVNHLPYFSTQNQLLWEKPSSLGQAPSWPALIPPRFIFLAENVSQLATGFSKMKLFHEGLAFLLNSLRGKIYTCRCHSLLYS